MGYKPGGVLLKFFMFIVFFSFPSIVIKMGGVSEKRTGNIAKRRLLVNPYPARNSNWILLFFYLNSEKGGIYESPPYRYVPNSSPAKMGGVHTAFSQEEGILLQKHRAIEMGETSDQSQGFRSPSPEIPRQNRKIPPWGPTPNSSNKKLKKYWKAPENTIFWVFFSGAFQYFLSFFWGRAPVRNFSVFSRNFAARGYESLWLVGRFSTIEMGGAESGVDVTDFHLIFTGLY